MLKKKSSNKKGFQRTIYEPYLSSEEIAGNLEKGILKGAIRLNPRNYKEGYITHSKLDSDVLIYDKDINRALYDDIVAVKIHSKSCWKVQNEINNGDIDISNISLKNIDLEKGDNISNQFLTIGKLLHVYPNFFFEKLGWDVTKIDFSDSDDFPDNCNDWWKYFQRTGKVVAVVHKMNSRFCVGSLCMPDNVQNVKYARFIPNDKRYPRPLIPLSDCPPDFIKRPQDYKDIKFIVSIGDWNEKDTNPKGHINQCLADMTMLEQETTKILAECGFEDKEFRDNILDSIPKEVLTASDFEYRRDVRNECVLSIDPKSARDLDDALHIKPLSPASDGTPLWEVGVHIADVSHYVTPMSDIDQEAQKRATTVYMVHKAVPMLPRQLCEHLCSLHPGSDKLSYSVIYKITDDCRIMDVWIGRTVMRSACKLSYEDAQMVLDNPTKTDWTENDFGQIFPPYHATDIATSILRLNHLAVQMRRRRFDNGALWLNHPKIGFVLNSERNNPLGYNTYKLAASNHLIEEWMLQANMTVAEFLHSHLPKLAFLRCHPSPTAKAIKNVNKQLDQMGLHDCHLTTGTTDEFQALMNRFDKDDHNQLLIVNIFNKAMQLAVYFCNDDQENENESQCHHFALNVPLYTHFTSPIRRYPDIIVHRQMTSILMTQQLQQDDTLTEKINWMSRTSLEDNCTTEQLSFLSGYCNKKKKDAKSADESSTMLFYSLFVEKSGPFTESGIVMGLLDKAFDVLLSNCGFTKRVYFDQLDARDASFDGTECKLTIFWNTSDHCRQENHPIVSSTVGLMTPVTIIVSATHNEVENSPPKLKFILPNPGCDLCANGVRGGGGSGDIVRDISELQLDLNIVDVESSLYNILDDI